MRMGQHRGNLVQRHTGERGAPFTYGQEAAVAGQMATVLGNVDDLIHCRHRALNARSLQQTGRPR